MLIYEYTFAIMCILNRTNVRMEVHIMAKKLEGNGLWESSRMMLPEHKERIRSWRAEVESRHEKPIPDEQAWEEWGRLMQESLEHGRLITLTVYDPYQDVVVTGQVHRIDQMQQRILFLHGQKTWVPFEDIIDVRGAE